MIWLSPNSGVRQRSVYFDVRDIAIHRNGGSVEGLIQGLLGDGQQELWGEVTLGREPRVNILPTWSEENGVETFDEALDEADLKRQLLGALNQALVDWGALTAPLPGPGGTFPRPPRSEYQ